MRLADFIGKFKFDESFEKFETLLLSQVRCRCCTLILREFDTAVRDCVEMFLGCSFDEGEWTLATLSTKLGGLGLRSTEHHSPAAYVASQAACHELCPKLDTQFKWEPNNIQSD